MTSGSEASCGMRRVEGLGGGSGGKGRNEAGVMRTGARAIANKKSQKNHNKDVSEIHPIRQTRE